MTMPEGDYPLGDPAGIRDSRPAPEPLTDPDCRDGKHASCVGGPCECPCHNDVPRPGDTGDSRSDQAALSLAAGADERTGPGHFQPEDRGPAIRIHAPDKDAWLASRRTGVTASEIGVLMGFAPETWNSPHRLFLSKTGQIPDTIPETARMRYGKHNEPFIAAEFMERYPQFAVEGDGEMLFAHPVREWQMATPDRLVFDAGSQPDDEDLYPLAVLQIKTAGFAGDDWGEEGSDRIPLYIRTQVLWEMDVVGVQNGFVA